MNNKNSNGWRHWLKVSAAFLPLSLASFAAPAGTISVGFTTTGSDTWGGSCGASCADLTLTGTTSLSGLGAYFGPSGTPDFTFSAQLDATADWFGSSLSGAAPAGGWQLADGSGDSLYGSMSGSMTGSPGDAAGWGALDFDVAGGTGLFDDASGSGGALALFDSHGGFGDAGILFLDPPSPASVPEPGTLALFAAALAALGWTARRRRATVSARRSNIAL